MTAFAFETLFIFWEWNNLVILLCHMDIRINFSNMTIMFFFFAQNSSLKIRRNKLSSKHHSKTWLLSIRKRIREGRRKYFFLQNKLQQLHNIPIQKQPSRGVLRKKSSENMQQIYRRTPMLLCNSIEITLRDVCSSLTLLHIFRTPFYKKTYRGLLLCNMGKETRKLTTLYPALPFTY